MTPNGPPIGTDLRIEWRPLAAMDVHRAAWSELSETAVTPNVFLSPGFASAAAAHLPEARHTEALAIWQGARMVGLFAGHVRWRPLPLWQGLVTPFSPLSTPLVAPDCVEPVIAAWLAAVAARHPTAAAILMPFAVDEGPLAEALDTRLAQQGLAAARFRRFKRTILRPSSHRGDPVSDIFNPKHRREVGRRGRRLSDAAPVEVILAPTAMPTADAIESFLKLEAAGWKGRAGTAALNTPAQAAFMRRAVAELAATGGAEIALSRRNDQTLAVLIHLRAGRVGWGWKTAFDEREARWSPGQQLLIQETRRLIAQSPSLDHIDSCAVGSHSMAGHLWRDRLAMADLLVPLTPNRALLFTLARAAMTAHRAAIDTARTAWRRLRRR